MLCNISTFYLYKIRAERQTKVIKTENLLEESPMKKRILAALLASATLISMAGCSSTQSTSSTTSSAGDGQSSATEAPANSGDATEAPAESGDATEAPTESEAPGEDKAAVDCVDDITLADGEGKVLNIAVWNDDWKKQFEQYIAPHMPKDVTVNFRITENKENAYQNKLDNDLPENESKSADEKIDMFLFEADYATKYVASDVTLDVKELGLTDDDVKDMYQYTKDVCTVDGVLKGVSWQATPGLFAYRREAAKEILGTDDPDKVQAELSDWTKFEAVAAKAKEKGYKMLSGYDDSYRVFSNNVSKPWVDENKNVQIDDQLMAWVDQTKKYTDEGYNNKTSLWDDAWTKDQTPGQKVFGFFYSTWGINFTLAGNSLKTPEKEGGKLEVGNGEYGQWAACYGPASYFWGGTWMAAAKGTDNPKLVGSIMKAFCCDPDFAKAFAKETQDYANNVPMMKELADDPDYGSTFLGGQNHYALFFNVADKISMDKCTIYDQACNEQFQGAFKDYFDGKVDKDTALANFYTKVKEKHPDLVTP